jgi:uncharacterized protein
MIVFRWDAAKAAANKRKHGIAFDEAMLVFDDPYALSQAERVVDEELRWQTIGMVADLILVLVAHTVSEQGDDEIIRIISARRATRAERRRYEQSRYENLG